MKEKLGHREQTCKWSCKIYDILIKILLSISGMLAAFLAFYCFRYSYYSQRDYGQPIQIVKDNSWMQAAICFLVYLAAWALAKILDKYAKCQEKLCMMVLLGSCVWIGIFGLVYVTMHPYYPSGDQLNVTAGASMCLNGNYEMLQPGGYIGLYGQQKGFMFLYEILFALFGEFCYDVAAKFHVLFYVMTLFFGFMLLKVNGKTAAHRILFCLLLDFCVPFFIYLPYIYGDLPSICFSMVLFWALESYGKTFKKRYIVFACIAAALGYMVRMNILIVLIAVGIGMALNTLLHLNWRFIMAGVCAVAIAFVSVKAVNIMYEVRSGYRNVEGLHSILWIAMGLQETDGMPGVYNHYQQDAFSTANGDQKLAAQIAREYIAQRAKEMKDNVPETVDFFKRKLQMQWLEPTYEGLYATVTFDEEKPVYDFIESLYYGEIHEKVWKFADCYQSVVYFMFFLFIIKVLFMQKQREKQMIMIIPLIAIVGGFLFSIIWESQCRYVLPYFIYMLIFVPDGLLATKRKGS